MSNHIEKDFLSKYQKHFRTFYSPGRINLIGEHTDYNLGYVMPAAIDRGVTLLIAPNNSDKIRITAYDLNEDIEVNIHNLVKSNQKWPDYLIGVVQQLTKNGHSIGGFDCLFTSDIPVGAGLSSSAAIECVLAYALNSIFSLGESRIALAKMAQAAEIEFVGVQCGIMDQFASIMGKNHCSLLLDCKTGDYSYIPFNFPDYQIVIINSKIKHDLPESDYNLRQQECQEVVRTFRNNGFQVESLRDISFESLEGLHRQLNQTLINRATYVLEENKRVLSFKSALEQSNMEKAGVLMYASHHGLRYLYEVSCSEIDFLVESTLEMDSVVGSRMMGGGFGGCTINIVQKDESEMVMNHIGEQYSSKTGISPDFIVADLVDGTHEIKQAGS